jgi:hypothetical protein
VDKNKVEIMKTMVPTAVLEAAIKSVKLRLNLTEEQQSKVIKRLIELWMFIYNKQISDDDTISLKGYTNIDKSELDKFSIKVGNTRFRYKNLLELISELVEVNDKYKVGSFCKGYRVITSSFGNSLSEIDIDLSKSFTIMKSKEYWIEKYPNYKHLIEDSYKSSIQLGEYINWMFENEDMELKPVIEGGVVKRRYLSRDKIWSYFFLALKINLSDLWFKVSNEGRFYSSISNLSYTSIDFLMFNYQSITDIDIKNCQPLLLVSLLGECKGLSDYKSDVESGVFYDKMANELNISRSEFKMLSYRFIFFNTKPLLSGKVYSSMVKLYGDVILKINNLNSDGKLSHKLQELESKIIVDSIGKLNIPKLLRHDQVICLKEHKELVVNELLKEFKKLRLKPIIN